MAENTEAKAEQAEETRDEQTSSEQEQHEGGEKQQEPTEPGSIFHKLFLVGLGIQKDFEDTIRNLVERGEMEAEKKEKVVDDFVKKAKESSNKFERRIEELINETIEGMKLVPKEKYDALEKRVQILETKILAMESRIDEFHSDHEQ